MSEAFEIISAEDLFFKPVCGAGHEEIVEGMVPLGLTILAGPPKSCKSWLALDMSIAVAEGQPFLRQKTLGCGVLYFALEDTPDRLQFRLHAIVKDEPPCNLHIVTRATALGDGFLRGLAESLNAYPDVRFIIVDTLQMIRKTGERPSNSDLYGRDTDELSLLKKFAEDRKVAVLIIHHTTKAVDSNDPLNDVRGSSGMTATPDSILILRKERVQKTGMLLNVSRDYPQWRMMLLFENCQWKFQKRQTEEEMAKEDVPDVLNRIVDLVHERGSWEGTMTQLLSDVEEHEMPANVLSRKIARFGNIVFEPSHIKINYKHTGSERRYRFDCWVDKVDQVSDDVSSVPSVSSETVAVSDEEREKVKERWRNTILG